MLIPISDLSIFVSNSTWSVYRFTIRSARRLVRSRTQGQQVDQPVSRWVGWSGWWAGRWAGGLAGWSAKLGDNLCLYPLHTLQLLF